MKNIFARQNLAKFGLKKNYPTSLHGRYFLSTVSNDGSYGRCKALKILYFGSDTFSLWPLKFLVSRMRSRQLDKSLIKNIQIVTSDAPLLIQEEKKQKSNDFIDFVKKENLQIHFWNKDPLHELSGFDFGIVASFGHLIPKAVIQSFKRGVLNAHPSLLPRWQGAAPIIHTILNGDKKAGVTIIDLSIGRFDKGKIFHQKGINVDETCTNEILTNELGIIAGRMILDVIDDFDNYQRNVYLQPEEGASYAPKISTNLSYIDFEKHDSLYIDRVNRAIGQKIGLHLFFDKKLIKLVDVKKVDKEEIENIEKATGGHYQVGESWFDRKSKLLHIKCLGGWLQVSKLQVQYKKPVRAIDFFNAYMVDRKNKGIIRNCFYSL